ncbi:hypothetical protein [Empedobacter brevis]|uniref:hypothetical protein n=1 Tax=Empedobacter brevis TaxID=247 RepID=UPI00131FF0E5|nr:hypothetical protein [Empedobacter brevis]QHC83486.1 hypothetical protein AS589_01085 [Empedobacter brevis]
MIKKCLQIGFLLIGSPLLLAQVEKPSEIFWKNLEKHCGKAYEGKLAEHITRDDFTGKKLTMHVKSCSSNEIKIPFNVGDNYSRTWILTKKDGIITLKHDHRHENGTSETITFYGGTNTNFGFKDFQMFPADQETANLIDYASTNIWWITLDDTTFSYNLQKAGSKTPFHVYFDLTKEITIPPAPWGWGTPR